MPRFETTVPPTNNINSAIHVREDGGLYDIEQDGEIIECDLWQLSQLSAHITALLLRAKDRGEKAFPPA